MSFSFDTLVPVAMAAVVVVLVLGFINMVRGGSANTSQLLMRWRVGLQLLAVILVLLAIWWRGG